MKDEGKITARRSVVREKGTAEPSVVRERGTAEPRRSKKRTSRGKPSACYNSSLRLGYNSSLRLGVVGAGSVVREEECYHEPVMSEEVISALNLRKNGIIVDATIGGGGHTKLILDAEKTVKVIGFDKDKDAVAHTAYMSEEYGERLQIFNDNFVNFRSRIALERIGYIDGILFDLGVSRHQIATASRGLSFDLDAALDMRMNQDSELTAADIINKYPIKKISEIIKSFGEEREANRIAKGIDMYRRYSPIKTTFELAEIIDKNTVSPYKIKAKARVFQALRIYLNGELEVLKDALCDAVEAMKPGGRIVVLTYHSLEDRIVKRFFTNEAKECICPSNFPKCVCSKQKRLKIINKKPILPTQTEISKNRSAGSAKMRVAERM